MATVPQLRAAGWTISAIRHARKTRWQEPLPRVVVPHRGPVDDDHLLLAQGLWAGRNAVLSGSAALARLAINMGDRKQLVTFVIPDSGRARRHGVVQLVRSTRSPRIKLKHGVVPVAEPARALADAAVHERHRAGTLEHAAISVLQRGLTTPERLEEELWSRPRQSVAPVWKGLGAFRGGAWSRPEGVLREVVEGDGGFPELLTNCRLESLGEEPVLIGVPDGYFEEAGVAVQVHSRQYHQGVDDAGGDQWARTVEKDGDLVAHGVRVVGVTPWTLYRRPGVFLARLHQAVALGLEGPRPEVRVVTRAERAEGATIS